MNLKITFCKPRLLVLLLVTLIATVSANAQQSSAVSAEAVKKYNEVQAEQATKSEKTQPVLDKKQQAEKLKTLCPHYPVSNTPGANKEMVLAVETWKKSFPEEYAAYLKIFKLKQ